MNTIEKRIQAYLSKIPTQKVEKVELASMRKVEQLYKELDRLMSDTERISGDVKNAGVLGEKTATNALNVSKEVKREIESVKSAANELGVKIDIDGYEAGVASMTKALENYKKGYSIVKRFTVS